MTVCHRLEYISQPATAVRDVTCNETTQCQPGSIEITPPTKYSDRVCEATTVAPTPAAAIQTNDTQDKGLSVGVIAAIAICTLFILMIIVVFAIWQRRKMTKVPSPPPLSHTKPPHWRKI